MLTAFDVSNFRGIKELSLQKLKQINVIAGKNSAGKTSLLEALLINAGKDNLSLPLTTNAMRGVQWFASDMEQSFGSLFYDGQLDKKIKFTGWEKKDWSKVELSLEPRSSITKNMTPVSVSTSQGSLQLKLDYSDYSKNSSTVRGYPKGDGFEIEPGKLTPTQHTGIYLASTTSGIQENVTRYTKLDNEKRSDIVVEAMRIVEPRLQSINIAMLSNHPVLFADIGLSRKIPLHFAGEGLQKMASIALAIANCPNGLVLIDEIENGFHYTVLKTMWSSLASLALKFNTQLVVSTHSWECLKAAGDMLANNEPEASYSLFRLDRQDSGEITAQIYEKEDLLAAFESGIEVR